MRLTLPVLRFEGGVMPVVELLSDRERSIQAHRRAFFCGAERALSYAMGPYPKDCHPLDDWLKALEAWSWSVDEGAKVPTLPKDPM